MGKGFDKEAYILAVTQFISEHRQDQFYFIELNKNVVCMLDDHCTIIDSYQGCRVVGKYC